MVKQANTVNKNKIGALIVKTCNVVLSVYFQKIAGIAYSFIEKYSAAIAVGCVLRFQPAIVVFSRSQYEGGGKKHKIN